MEQASADPPSGVLHQRYRSDSRDRLACFATSRSLAGKRRATLRLLFVCTGNICRSPMAERLAVEFGARKDVRSLKVGSAGTHAVVAHPIHHHAAAFLVGMGCDVSGFAARQLTAMMAADADLVITMTKVQRDLVLERAPRLLRRVFTLGEASRLAELSAAESAADLAGLRPRLSGHDLPDVADPIGQDAEVFAAIGGQIAELLLPLIELCGRSSASAGASP